MTRKLLLISAVSGLLLGCGQGPTDDDGDRAAASVGDTILGRPASEVKLLLRVYEVTVPAMDAAGDPIAYDAFYAQPDLYAEIQTPALQDLRTPTVSSHDVSTLMVAGSGVDMTLYYADFRDKPFGPLTGADLIGRFWMGVYDDDFGPSNQLIGACAPTITAQDIEESIQNATAGILCGSREAMPGVSVQYRFELAE